MALISGVPPLDDWASILAPASSNSLTKLSCKTPHKRTLFTLEKCALYVAIHCDTMQGCLSGSTYTYSEVPASKVYSTRGTLGYAQGNARIKLDCYARKLARKCNRPAVQSLYTTSNIL